ncbi:MAG: hypothetical protein ACK4MZ_05570, partial [Thermomonas haemolytica]
MSMLAEWWPFDGFAWPWLLLALPLPLLVRLLWPPRAATEAALRVPWGARLRQVAVGAPGPARGPRRRWGGGGGGGVVWGGAGGAPPRGAPGGAPPT